jgi:hypothetical protein
MTSTTRAISAFALILTLSFVHASTATGSPADPPEKAAVETGTSATAQDDDDPAAFVPAEPDFHVVNLPTTLQLPLFKGNFSMTHRFGGNLRRGNFADQASSFFGIDTGASVSFEYRMGLLPHVQGIVHRDVFQRTVQFAGKFDIVRQHAGVPLSISPLISVEGTDNFQENYAPAVSVAVSRRLGDVFAAYAVPTWVHNSAASAGFDDDTVFFGVGGRLRIRPTVYLAGEISPRLSGYRPGDAGFGFGIEKRAGGHVFQLNFTNSTATTLAQIARGGPPKNITLGFNLTRKFY